MVNKVGNTMGSKEKKKRLYNLAILAPCMFELWIFLCFHFADWRRELPEDIQFRIFWGSLVIAIAFLFYYLGLLVTTIYFYNEKNKNIKIATIILNAIIGLLSYLIGYFV